MAITVFLSRSPGQLNQWPGGPAFLGAGFLYHTLSPTCLISNWLTSCLHPGYIIIWRPLFILQASQIALIQLVQGQGYNILIFLDRMHLLFTLVHFQFWQPGRVGGQYTTHFALSDPRVLSSLEELCSIYAGYLSRWSIINAFSLRLNESITNRKWPNY